ncbi:kinase-like domain-containing protein [Daldinia grandis]|nr:kinase-like domain-containing protein [Daldinia grandis]
MSQVKSLGDFLRENTNPHPRSDVRYLTLDCLWRRLLPAHRIEEHIRRYYFEKTRASCEPGNDLNHYLKQICPGNVGQGDSPVPEENTYIRLFATLALADEASLIFKFIDNGVSDYDLPMAPLNADASSTERLTENLPWNMSRRNIDSFHLWQWRMNVPFLKYGRHQNFDGRVVLPFVPNFTQNSSGQAHTTEEGGYGEVSYVKIHEKCHDFYGRSELVTSPEGPFALKRIKHTKDKTTDEKFGRERDMLERFGRSQHPTIITTLASYRHGDERYILFPWAEYDLDRYCETNVKAPDDPETVCWIADQSLKLAEAIDVIHAPLEEGSEEQKETLFGRHGDIKAENILVFGRSGKRPTLILSDFGLCSVHHDWSKSNVPNQSLPVTPDFRPPECEMKEGRITRAFDIWTLGCLFLDLLTWLLGGNSFRERFKKKRTTPWIGGYNTPIYFEIVRIETGKYGFIIKEEVREWFATMHNDVRCTQFMHDFLRLIEEEMLIVETKEKKRMRTDGLLTRLREFSGKCKKDKAYCLDGVKQKDKPAVTASIAEAQLNDNALQTIQNSDIVLRTITGPIEPAEPTRERDNSESIRNATRNQTGGLGRTI